MRKGLGTPPLKDTKKPAGLIPYVLSDLCRMGWRNLNFLGNVIYIIFVNSILMSIAERMPRAFLLAALSPVLVIKKSAQRLH